MRVLLTGSSGLIGRALAETLGALGHDVVGLDLRDADGADVRDRERVRSRMVGCDGVVHLAAVSRVAWGEQDPDTCRSVNLGGTESVLAVAQASARPPWVVFASSREVYGEGDGRPTAEDAPLRPLNVYARTKVEGERRVTAYGALGHGAAVVRLSNVYGAAADHVDRVVPAFARGAVHGETLRVDGHDQCFDFVHLTDAVRGLCAVIGAVAGGRHLPPIHLVTGRSTRLEDLAELAVRCAGTAASIRHAPARSFDVSRFRGDPRRARDLLGWEAQIALEQGMAELVEAFAALSAPRAPRSPHPGPPAR